MKTKPATSCFLGLLRYVTAYREPSGRDKHASRVARSPMMNSSAGIRAEQPAKPSGPCPGDAASERITVYGSLVTIWGRHFASTNTQIDSASCPTKFADVEVSYL